MVHVEVELMTKVLTRNNERTIAEMYEMMLWVKKTFPHNSDDTEPRCVFGKDPNVFGNSFPDGPHDVEWFEFKDKKDAEWFMLRWG